jgi:hypothetical protein
MESDPNLKGRGNQVGLNLDQKDELCVPFYEFYLCGQRKMPESMGNRNPSKMLYEGVDDSFKGSRCVYAVYAKGKLKPDNSGVQVERIAPRFATVLYNTSKQENYLRMVIDAMNAPKPKILRRIESNGFEGE